MASTIDAVPDEIIYKIFAEIKRSNSPLVPCLLVCQRWNRAALPYINSIIVLYLTNLSLFSTSFNPTHGPLVKSLTILISYSTADVDVYSQDSTTIGNTLGENLLALSPILPHLINLTTFSFNIPPFSSALVNVPRDSLAALVDNLPVSCVNLEINTATSDVSASSIDGKHLCESLRHVLPRMKNVRIHLGAMCSSTFGHGPVIGERPENIDNFTPIALLEMESLLVNCQRAMYCTPLCGSDDPSSPVIYERSNASAWSSLYQALRCLAQKEGHCQASAKLYLMGAVARDTRDSSKYNTYTRDDVLRETTIATPSRMVWIDRHSCLLRTLDGRELMGNPAAIMQIAEGELWRSSIDGSRIPASLLQKESKGFVAKLFVPEVVPPEILRTSEEWREEYPKRACTLWMNEKVTGMRLLDAEERGRSDVFSPQPVVERTPRGWQRESPERGRLTRED
ncbi:hypothetical protein BJ875DRAFT_464803 [Amylocarpus encephaloides]|uniref:F-box domain-containing protein n=1 Tax=Amylocarpus encephaloides TaxID=45428 RepID=A0A9P8C5M9_9HELO|nr:hypothetical protein BJ875DRAFT_464803 [Amylocarpus encephaloides]